MNFTSYSDVVLIISDLAGRVVERIENFNSSSSVQFGQELPLGVYLMEVNVENESRTMKLVKQL